MGSLHLNAADFSVDYTGEFQTSFKKSNFLNLLHLGAEFQVSNSLTVQVATISVAKCKDEQIVHDLQSFSNIEEDNLVLAPAVCGLGWKIGDYSARHQRYKHCHELFFGVRNMNEDYFTSPVTSFFANSSCGVYPPISANLSIANYPMASMCVHYSYDNGRINFMTSLYNGVGYNHFFGRESVFRVSLKSDGVFSISQVEYRRNGSSYFCGNSMLLSRDVVVSPWLYAEQRIGKCEILAGSSHSFSKNADCKDFIGFGANYELNKLNAGVFIDYARFKEIAESAVELSCRYKLNDSLYIQPIVHLLRTGDKSSFVSCLRVVVRV